MIKRINMTCPQFTRYLYLKDEVIIALIASFWNKDSDQALYWAYELYYSGFECDLKTGLIRIYYDFYATLNPHMESQLLTKLASWDKTPIKTVASIVYSFIKKQHNYEVFLLRQMVKQFELEPLEGHWLKTRPGTSLAKTILETIPGDKVESYFIGLLDDVPSVDKDKELKMFRKATLVIDPRIVLLQRVLSYYDSIHNQREKKNSYVTVDEEKLKQYETLTADYDSGFYPYKVFRSAVKYSVDHYGVQGLFCSLREKLDPKEMHKIYTWDWLYYASFTPVWKKRIIAFNGFICHRDKKILFMESEAVDEAVKDADDWLDEFYDQYGYEPDEQPSEVLAKTMPPIKTKRFSEWWSSVKKENMIAFIEEDEISELEKCHLF